MNISIDNANLSLREIEVLKYVISGQTNKKIATNLNIYQKTIEFHLRNIYEKINVKNKIEAAVWAVKNLNN